MRDRVRDVLINPTWEQVVERDPLIAFSFYLSGRKNVLLAIADEIIENLDQAFYGPLVSGGKLDRAESLFWLWTLGAYEIVRTMCQAQSCFSERALDELVRIKKTLSAIRMPAAKMEKRGKRAPVISDRSPAGWDIPNKDLFVGDPESKPDVSARFVLTEFDRVFASLTRDDVRARHEASYSCLE
jgi:hypothetical protein